MGAAGPEAGRELGRVELLDARRARSTQRERKKSLELRFASGGITAVPSVSSRPSIRLRFWTPWPEAPFQMLSIAAKAITRPRSSTVT